MKNHRKEEKIKKKTIIFIMLSVLLFINKVNASEYIDVTQDVEIKYKWYKEKITGDYYLKKDITEEDVIDQYNIKYGEYKPLFQTSQCKLPREYYDIEVRLINVYEKVKNVRYIILENFDYQENIKIYHDGTLVNFKIISNENNILKLELNTAYMCEKILFYIEKAKNYKISLYETKKFDELIVSKEIVDEEVFSPDKSWITDETKFQSYETEQEIKDSDFIKKKSTYFTCRSREIFVYKYEIEREYYDDNYHLNVDGYIKDFNDYKIYYKGKPLTNIIEITKNKIIKEPKYIYVEKENLEQKNDSSNQINCPEKIKTEIKTNTIEKEVFKIPKTIFIILGLLILIIIFLLKKCRTKKITSIVESV